MNRWFRYYDDTINEPKVLKLSDALFRVWVGVLCVASKHGGTLPSIADTALLLRMKPERLAVQLAALTKAELIDNDETGLHPHNWNARQYKSDVSNDRVKRYRDRHRNDECNVTETPSETESDTEAEQNRNKKAPAADPLIGEFAIWYAEYPLKKGRGQALKAFRSVRKSVDLATLIAGAVRYANDPARDPKFTKHPATWLTGECWLDEPSKGKPNGSKRLDHDEQQRLDRAAILRGMGPDLVPNSEFVPDHAGPGEAASPSHAGGSGVATPGAGQANDGGNRAIGGMGEGVFDPGAGRGNGRNELSSGPATPAERSAGASLRDGESEPQMGHEAPAAGRSGDHGAGRIIEAAAGESRTDPGQPSAGGRQPRAAERGREASGHGAAIPMARGAGDILDDLTAMNRMMGRA